MKNSIYNYVFFTFFVISFLFFSSCDHSSTSNEIFIDEQATRTAPVRNEQGRLIFKDRTSYDFTIETLIDEAATLNAWEKGLQFYSMRVALLLKDKGKGIGLENWIQPREVKDEKFLAMLSPKGIIQIGNWIFKIDFQNKRVLALNQRHIYYLESLKKGEMLNGIILNFSMNENVLDILEASDISPKISNKGTITDSSKNNLQIFCGGGVGERHSPRISFFPPDNSHAEAHSDYDKYGIFFKLHTTLDYWSAVGGYPEFYMDKSFYYRTNCKRYKENSDNSPAQRIGLSPSQGGPYGPDFYNEKVYNGSRGLDEFRLKVNYYVKFAGTFYTIDVPLIEAS